MKQTSTLTALALILGLGTATAALAEGTESSAASGEATQSTTASTAGEAGTFDWSTSADTSMDSRIDADEAAKAGEQHFGAYDANADGYIARDEYLSYVGTSLDARQKARAANMAGISATVRDDTAFSELDADGDGKLSRGEYMDRAQQAYGAAAEGADGVATDAYSSVMRQSYDPKSADLNKDGTISDWEAAADVEMDFGMRDADADDLLSQEEWSAKLDQPYDAARSEKRFSTLDADKDERLSSEEFSSWRAGQSSVARSSTEQGTSETAEETGNTADSAEPAAGGDAEGWSVWNFRRYHF
jgi:Ca2+-binding EF-hand superfamily protein